MPNGERKTIERFWADWKQSARSISLFEQATLSLQLFSQSDVALASQIVLIKLPTARMLGRMQEKSYRDRIEREGETIRRHPQSIANRLQIRLLQRPNSAERNAARRRLQAADQSSFRRGELRSGEFQREVAVMRRLDVHTEFIDPPHRAGCHTARVTG